MNLFVCLYRSGVFLISSSKNDTRRALPGSKLALFPYNRGWSSNQLVGVYIPIIRTPIKGGMTIPNIGTFDHGTYGEIQ